MPPAEDNGLRRGRTWRGLLCGVALAVVVTASMPPPSMASPSSGGVSPVADTAPTPTASFTSEAHGYTVTMPAGWVALPRRGAEDLADVRFRHETPTLVGFYQVYEGSVTDRADKWYENARTRYESAAAAMKQIERLTFSDLETAPMGGEKAYSFGFVTEFKQGPPVATRIIFTPRRVGERIDIHEIVLTGSTTALAEGATAVDALLGAVRFKK